MPTKGIPLPFLSYGGSALLADLLAVGILLNLSQHASSGRRQELGCRCAIVLGLFGMVFARGMRAAVNAPDTFGRLLGVGLAVMIVVQALVNISVVLALVPTKGIPLPFLSYGGSALWADLIAVGVLLNVSQHAP